MKEPYRQRAWWVGIETTCSICDEDFVLTMSSRIISTTTDPETGQLAAGVKCPECGNIHTVFGEKKERLDR